MNTNPKKQTVIEDGELITDWACDWDPISKERQSNGSIEMLYLYKGQYYIVNSNWDQTKSYSMHKVSKEWVSNNE